MRTKGKVLFLDARSFFKQVSRAIREFAPEQLEFLANVVRLNRGDAPEFDAGSQSMLRERFPAMAYADLAGLCKEATLAEVEAQGWSLNPGRYVGVGARAADGFDFAERLPQPHVRVDVAFYDEAERAKLLAYSTGQTIEALVRAPIDVPMAEFLAYYLFHRKRLGSPGFRDLAAIGRKLGAALAHLDGCVTFNGHSIRTADGVGHQLTEVSEHIGESIGLSVVSRIHGLNEADWAPIPEQRGRTAQPSFDFELSVPSPVDGPRDIALPESVRGLERAVEDDTASDGNSLVQVENKGSSAIDNREHSPAVVAQKRKIDKKKAKLRSANVTASTIRYGTIAVVDRLRNELQRCGIREKPSRSAGTPMPPRLRRCDGRLRRRPPIIRICWARQYGPTASGPRAPRYWCLCAPATASCTPCRPSGRTARSVSCPAAGSAAVITPSADRTAC